MWRTRDEIRLWNLPFTFLKGGSLLERRISVATATGQVLTNMCLTTISIDRKRKRFVTRSGDDMHEIPDLDVKSALKISRRQQRLRRLLLARITRLAAV